MATFNQEIAERTAFVEQSVTLLNELLQGRPDVHRALGDMASTFIKSESDFYIPQVLNSGEINIPAEHRDDDTLPILPLRDDEVMMRNARNFTVFTPRQRSVVRQFYTNHSLGLSPELGVQTLDAVSRRARKVATSEVLSCHLEDRQPTMTTRMTYPVQLDKNNTVYYNMRPLIIVRYVPEAYGIAPEAMAGAYAIAEQVTKHPVQTVQGGEEGFTAARDVWSNEAFRIMDMVKKARKDHD